MNRVVPDKSFSHADSCLVIWNDEIHVARTCYSCSDTCVQSLLSPAAVSFFCSQQHVLLHRLQLSFEAVSDHWRTLPEIFSDVGKFSKTPPLFCESACVFYYFFAWLRFLKILLLALLFSFDLYIYIYIYTDTMNFPNVLQYIRFVLTFVFWLLAII